MSNKITPLGYLLIATFFILLAYSGWIAAKSIDWDVLERMEKAPLSLPSPIPSQIPTTNTTPVSKNN